MKRIIVLVRHGQSEFNSRKLYTGRCDPELTPQGIEEARAAGRKLGERGHQFDIAFTSEFRRAQHTLELILAELRQGNLTIVRDGALNERDYGVLTGLDRQQATERFGKANLLAWRRSFDAAPPGGESLRETVRRATGFYERTILPFVLEGKRVLVSAHSNSLRALIMAIEKLGEEQAAARSFETGVPVAYCMSATGSANSWQTLRPA
ncbi:MAG TPA: 2,3-bisphosphoglycerate-dependent phosphoglycerate mutase [Aestuariivirgaceae bacterium]|nr:2,3-bisphosphoglycerate-dependent phosphoglycerate mutase [Aestuariivirgaceae bacterium]